MNIIKEKFFEILGVVISLITVPVIIFNIPGSNSFFIKGLIALSADLLILTLIMFLLVLVIYGDKKKIEETVNNLYSYAVNLENERNGLKEELISLKSYVGGLQLNNQQLNEELEKVNKKIELMPINLSSIRQRLSQNDSLGSNRLQKGFLSDLYEKSQKNNELNNET